MVLVFAAFEVGWLLLLLVFVAFDGDLVGCLPPFFMVVDILDLLDLVPRGEVGVLALHTLPLVFFEAARNLSDLLAGGVGILRERSMSVVDCRGLSSSSFCMRYIGIRVSSSLSVLIAFLLVFI